MTSDAIGGTNFSHWQNVNGFVKKCNVSLELSSAVFLILMVIELCFSLDFALSYNATACFLVPS